MKKPESDDRITAPGQQRAQGPLRRFVWNVPLGWQLSALYTALLVVTLSLVGTLVYFQQESFLVQDVANRLEQEAAHVVAIPVAPPGGQSQPSRPPGERPPSDGGGAFDGQDHVMSNLVRGLSGPGVTVAVLDNQGKVITSTQPLEGANPPTVDPVSAQQAASALAANGKPTQWILTNPDGSRDVVVLMALTSRAPDFGGTQPVTPTTLLIEQSASLAAADAALNSLGILLIIGVIGGTIVGVVLVLAFTRGLLRPLDDMADTAEAIAGGDLQRRLQLPPGKSEVARLGNAFDNMVGRLVASLETQRRFVADASHELRTPLTSLKGLAEILVIGAHGNDPKVIEESAGAIRSELDRLSRLVSDLLTLSRLDSTDGTAAMPVRHTRIDLCETIGAAAAQVSTVAEARGINLTERCAAPLWILGDAGQIKQVLLNLLDNALRYTPRAGQVNLEGRVEEGSAVIEVRDTGSGINEKDLPHVFDRFYRGDTSRSRATGNSGLGLAIAQRIVHAHGGSIGVESTVGKGTRFTIYLPLAPARPTPEEAPAEAATVASGS